MIIYVDVLIAINMLVNFLLLRATGAISGSMPKFYKVAAGAFLGALGSLIIFFPLGIWSLLLFKIVLSTIMVGVAFGIKNKFKLLLNVISLLASSFLLSGGLQAWQNAKRPIGVLVNAGAVYFDISPISLLICCVLGYLVTLLLGQFFSISPTKGNSCKITVLNNGAMASFYGLIDTGNNLVEPFSRCPVIVCQQEALGKTLPLFIKNFMLEDIRDKQVRLISYKTIDGEGLLPAFVPEEIWVEKKEEKPVKISDCYLAVLNANLGNLNYSAICNPQIFYKQHQKTGGEIL